MIEKLIKTVMLMKNKNNGDMKKCQEAYGIGADYVRGYTDALKHQNELLDKQIAILSEK